MAKFRKVHTSFWDDPYIEKLSAEDRYFYLFLLTNPLCTECGIYAITVKKMTYYTGYNEDAVRALINRFASGGRIVYDTQTDEMCILHKPNYIERLGKPVIDCLNSELGKVKNKNLIYRQLQFILRDEVRNVYVTWASRRQEGEEEKEEEEKKNTPSAATPANPVVAQQPVENSPKSGSVLFEDEKKSNPQPPSFESPSVVYDAEKCIAENPVWFERLLMDLKIADKDAAQEVVRKYHLHQLEKNNYPMGRNSIFAGVEKWMRNEYKFSKTQKNGTHQQSATAKSSANSKTAGAGHVLDSLLGDLVADHRGAASA